MGNVTNNQGIVIQGPNGNNTFQLIGHQGRKITPDIELLLQPFVQSGQTTEVRTDSSAEAINFGKEIGDYLMPKGVPIRIDQTSIYIGSFGYGLHLDLNNHIIKIGKNDNQ